MAAERSNKHWRRYVLESSSEEEGEEEEASLASSRSLDSTSSRAANAKQTQRNPIVNVVTKAAVADGAVSSGVASASKIARSHSSPDQKSKSQMSQGRRWGEYDLEDSDSSDSDVLGSLGERLKSSLRLTSSSPPSSNNNRKGDENEEPRSRRKIDHQQKPIDEEDDEVQILDDDDDDDDDEVEILSESNDRPKNGATVPRRRPAHRPGGLLMDDDESEAEYDDDDVSLSSESASSSSRSDSVVWEEINRKQSPQRQGDTQDRIHSRRDRHDVENDRDSEEEEGQWNDDFLGMIPPGSAWWYDQDKRHFYLEESDEESSSSLAKKQQQWPRLSVPMALFRTLYTHQKSGVEWMAGLHVAGIGGILGDDMGMGKTYMTLTYLFSLMRCKTIRNALIVVPLSVLRSWEREAAKVKRLGDSKCTVTVLTSNVSGRERILAQALSCSASNPRLVITTYGLVQSSTQAFMDKSDSGPRWDYVILDEAHTVKNPTARTSVACRSLCRDPNTRRLMLTGTPIMNNLVELWSLFDWATSGKLLGPIKAFKDRFAKPIEHARDKHATASQIRDGQIVNEQLQLKLRPYFLQRLKADYLKDQLPSKVETVVWTHLSNEQRRKYSAYVQGENSIVRAILKGEFGSALEAITWLKMLSSHPLLVDKRFTGDEVKKKAFKGALESMDLNAVVRDSAKLGIAVDLVKQLRGEGHRTLVFSQSTRMLDILEAVFRSNRIKASRIDGSTKEKDRQWLVDSFNENSSSCDVMLLSTKAAGVGLTLTGADRVILYDPSWNPASDSQAVDRAYRIGQTRPVLVYRLITAGTVEEKIYEKQIYKDGIRRTVFTECATIQRYFDKHELRRLFKLSEPGVCSVLEMIRGETEHLNINWDRHAFVTGHSSVVGMSLHDGLYLDEQSQENDEDLPPATPFAKKKSTPPDRRQDPASLELVPLECTPPPRNGKSGRNGAASGLPTRLGRAQRILAGRTNALVPVGELGRATTNRLVRKSSDSSSSGSECIVLKAPPKPHPPIRVARRAPSPVEHVDEASTETESEVDAECFAYADTEEAAPDRPEKENAHDEPRFHDAQDQTPSVQLQLARALYQDGKPRRSLQLLLNVLHSQDKYQQLDRDEKTLLHQCIADAASTTGLL